ncbi:hypothetical protein [Pedobacter foliorum]|uniref:hypothetical protein n=1 Tax=Pedobacter foliorum TaxID=2739058 RepID=UPI001564F249|nr:hypothetical protein [Pedobacter foliorum]NRF41997.1 hypothetical protein [Pedobacter foliorum]
MKKLLFLILCTTTLGLVSCKKDTIVNQTTPNRTFIYTIKPSSWTLNANKDTYTTILDIPEIDNITLDDEGVLVYITDPDNANVQKPLPHTFNFTAYSYEFTKGEIRVFIQNSDTDKLIPAAPTKPITAKVIIIPSDFQP